MADKLAKIICVPGIYEKGTTGSYVYDDRGMKKLIAIGDDVNKTDNWEAVGFSEFVAHPQVEIVSNLAGVTFSKSELDEIVPDLMEHNIKPALVVYENSLPNLNTIFGAGFTFDIGLFKTDIQTLLDQWSGITFYNEYFNNYPHHLVLDFETKITNYVNGDIDLSGSTCTAALNIMKLGLSASNDLSPASIVYHYNVPALPYFFQGTTNDSSTWYYKNPAYSASEYTTEKNRLLTQQKQKLAYFQSKSDLINIEGYPKYTEGTVYANSTKEWIYNACYSVSNELLRNKKTSLFTSFVVFAGSEYNMSGLTLGAIQALPTLVITNSHMTTYILEPAKNAGVRSLFFWDSWKYNIDTAANPLTGTTNVDQYIYLNRKIINELFTDTGIGTTYGLTADANWALNSTRLNMLKAAKEKIVTLAEIFRNL